MESSLTLRFQDAVETINGLRFAREPQEGFGYANFTYDLMGVVILELAEMPFQDFIRTRILQRLEMHDTTRKEPSPGCTPIDAYMTTGVTVSNA